MNVQRRDGYVGSEPPFHAVPCSQVAVLGPYTDFGATVSVEITLGCHASRIHLQREP